MRFLLILFFLISLNLMAEDSKPQEQNANKAAELDINNSFITKYEYGKMLFNNPRGIGCNKCHGDDAKGKKIVEFKHQLENESKRVYNCSLVAPDIKDIDYQTFYAKVNTKKNPTFKFDKEQVCDKLIYYGNVMPTYFLVEEEIEAIYYYIKNKK